MRAPADHRSGRPSWCDLATVDLDNAMAFYHRLFGWDYEVEPSSGGGYYMAVRDGDVVAGLATSPNPNFASRWSLYLGVDDAADIAERATAAGGTVLVAPMEVGPAGTMAYVADPGGAAIGLWQGGTLSGAARVVEPGTFTWAELGAADIDSAASFYNAMVGMIAEIADSAQSRPYTFFKVGDSLVAGAMTRERDGNDSWQIYLGVADADEACGAAVAAGGEVMSGPVDHELGRVATMKDPQGATFGVISLSEWPK